MQIINILNPTSQRVSTSYALSGIPSLHNTVNFGGRTFSAAPPSGRAAEVSQRISQIGMGQLAMQAQIATAIAASNHTSNYNPLVMTGIFSAIASLANYLQVTPTTSSPALSPATSSPVISPAISPQGIVDKALDFWKKLAKEQNPEVDFSLASLTVDEQYEKDTVLFLNKLTTTAEYNNKKIRGAFACRVLNAVQVMAKNEEIKKSAVIIMSHAVTSCADGHISSLDDIEVMIAVSKLEGDDTLTSEKLRKAAKGFLLLDMLKAKAEEHMSQFNKNELDEIEIVLALKIGLTKTLNLPIETQSMNYRGSAHISDPEIEAIGKALLEECTEEKVDLFLKDWKPWNRYQRRTALLPYDKLPQGSSSLERTCCIMQSATDQPVEYLGKVFDYEAFKTCYVEKGIDPFTSLPIDLTHLKRI